MKKFALGLLSIAIAGVVAFPSSVGAVKADSYYEEFAGPELLSTSPDFAEMKRDLLYAKYFHQAEILGNMIGGFQSALGIAFNEMSTEGKNDYQKGFKERLKKLNQNRNIMAADLKYVNDPIAASVLSDYLKAINRLTSANSYLEQYYRTGSEYSFNMYLKNSGEGFDLYAYAQQDANIQYNYYINKSINSLTDFGY